MKKNKQFIDTRPIPGMSKRKTRAQWKEEARNMLLEFDEMSKCLLNQNANDGLRFTVHDLGHKLRDAVYALLKAI